VKAVTSHARPGLKYDPQGSELADDLDLRLKRADTWKTLEKKRAHENLPRGLAHDLYIDCHNHQFAVVLIETNSWCEPLF